MSKSSQDHRPGIAADLAAAASMASAAVLVRQLRRNHPVVVEDTAPSGLQPMEPVGVLATIGTRIPALRFPTQVLQRYSATRGGQMAALVAFTGFLSIFPLLIAVNSVLDMVLRTRPDLRARLVATTLGSIPVIGDQLKVGTAKGNGVLLAVGLVGALWAGLSAMTALQTAYDDMWQVLPADRPNFLVQRGRALGGLLVVAISLAGGTALSGLAAAASLPLAWLWGIAAGLVLNVIGVGIAQCILGSAIRRRDVRVGAVTAGVLLTVLQLAGGILVTHYLAGSSATYGTFSTVIALTSWFGLNAQIALIGVCVNAERAARRAAT